MSSGIPHFGRSNQKWRVRLGTLKRFRKDFLSWFRLEAHLRCYEDRHA